MLLANELTLEELYEMHEHDHVIFRVEHGEITGMKIEQEEEK